MKKHRCVSPCRGALSIVVSVSVVVMGQVKVAAVTAAIASLPFVPQGLRRSRMLPTLRSMFQTVCSRNLSLSSSSASGGPTVRPTLGFATPITSSAAGILSPTAATRKAEAMLKCLAAQFGLVVSHCIKLGDFNTTGEFRCDRLVWGQSRLPASAGLLLTSTGVSQRRGSFLLMDPRHTEDSAEDEAADSSDAAAGSRTEVDDKSKRRTDLMLLSLLRFFSVSDAMLLSSSCKYPF